MPHWCHHESEMVRHALPFLGLVLGILGFYWHKVYGFFRRKK
jgi:hypothetical protein